MTGSDRSRSRCAFAGAKAAVDPRGVMNPGVLVDPCVPIGPGARIAPAAA